MTQSLPIHSLPTPIIANIEAEGLLLGGLMNANNLVDRIADRLKADDFAEALHGRIFDAIVREAGLGRSATPPTLKHYFDDDPSMKELGGVSYLAKLSGGMSGGAAVFAVDGNADLIIELSQKRRLVESLRDIIASASDPETESRQLAADAESALADAMRDESEGIELSLGECAFEALKGIERNEPGILSGIGELDRAIGALRPRNLAILAGRPGMCKTAVALAYAKEAARRGVGSIFASLEMCAEELGERALADETFDEEARTGVPYDLIFEARIDRRGFQLLSDARDKLDTLPMQIIDTAAIRVAALHRLVRRWKRRMAARGEVLGLVVVDYLQLMRPDGKTTGNVEAVTEISKGLKMIAKAENVAVLALSQLSRKVEERTDKRPMLSDLRESGQIEQDADVVCFLYRPAYYLQAAEPDLHDNRRSAWELEMDKVRNEIHFICAKRRKGGPRTTVGRWYGQYQAVRG